MADRWTEYSGTLRQKHTCWQLTVYLLRLLTAAECCRTTLPPSSSSVVLYSSKCSTAASLWLHSSLRFLSVVFIGPVVVTCAQLQQVPDQWPLCVLACRLLQLYMSALFHTFPAGYQDFAVCTCRPLVALSQCCCHCSLVRSLLILKVWLWCLYFPSCLFPLLDCLLPPLPECAGILLSFMFSPFLPIILEWINIITTHAV